MNRYFFKPSEQGRLSFLFTSRISDAGCREHTMSKSALELVVQLKTLASEPNNRAHMCQGDHVLPPLVMWLDHPSSDVVFNGTASAHIFFPHRAGFQNCVSSARVAWPQPDARAYLCALQSLHGGFVGFGLNWARFFILLNPGQRWRPSTSCHCTRPTARRWSRTTSSCPSSSRS